MKKYRKSGKQVRKNGKFRTEHISLEIYQKKYKFVNQGNQCVIHNNPYRVFLAGYYNTIVYSLIYKAIFFKPRGRKLFSMLNNF